MTPYIELDVPHLLKLIVRAVLRVDSNLTVDLGVLQVKGVAGDVPVARLVLDVDDARDV